MTTKKEILEDTETKYQQWPSLPVGMRNTQLVWLDETLYVGGGETFHVSKRNDEIEPGAELYSFKPGVDTEWQPIDTPTYQFGLTAHNSQLLLVGGREIFSGRTTNEVFTLIDGEFEKILPPLLEKRASPSVVSFASMLVVARGENELDMLLSTEVLKDGQWQPAAPLPKELGKMGNVYEMSSVVNDNSSRWYLLNGKTMYSVSLESLIAGNEQSLWKPMPDALTDSSVLAFFDGNLLSIGVDVDNPITVISAFSHYSYSWKHVSDLPISKGLSATVLPSEELVIIGQPLPDGNGKFFSKVFIVSCDSLDLHNEAHVECVNTIQQLKKDIKALKDKLGTASNSLANPNPASVASVFVLPGVGVDGRVTVEVTNSAQSFSWDDYGFNLHIPQDSLPADHTHSVLLDIICSTNGNYQPPDGHEWLSPVFWVRPTPLCRFKKPLTIEIEHCAKMTSTTELTFVKALCFEENMPYKFKLVKNIGTFSTSSSFGSLEVRSFSGYGVSGKGIEKHYTASFYYHTANPRSIDIYFVIAVSHKAYEKKVKKLFRELQADKRLTFTIEFEKDKINLDIPREGVYVDKWKLEPMVFPAEIHQRDVEFTKRLSIDSVPYQTLKALLPLECTGPLNACTYFIDLKGAKAPKQAKIELDAFTPPLSFAVDVHQPERRPNFRYQGSDPMHYKGFTQTAVCTQSYGYRELNQYEPFITRSLSAPYLVTYGSQEAPFWPLENPFFLRGFPEIQPSNWVRQSASMAMSIEQLVDDVGISRELLDRPVSDLYLAQIVAPLLSNWRQYAVALGLSEQHITAAANNELLEDDMKKNEVLYLWKKFYPFKATFTTLVETCLRECDYEPAKRICEMVKEEFVCI